MVKRKNKLVGAGFGMKEPRILRFKRLRDGPTDQPTDRRTDMTSYRDARTHLKNAQNQFLRQI